MPAFASYLRPSLRLATTAQPARTFSSSSARSAARMFLTGRLANDPEVQATSTGQDLIKYSIATSYGPKDNRQTSFFRITSFAVANQRDYLLNLQKGTLVFLEGDASMRQWEDADGKRHSSLSIIQRSIEVLRRPASAFTENENENGSQ